MKYQVVIEVLAEQVVVAKCPQEKSTEISAKVGQIRKLFEELGLTQVDIYFSEVD